MILLLQWGLSVLYGVPLKFICGVLLSNELLEGIEMNVKNDPKMYNNDSNMIWNADHLSWKRHMDID
jgi:hypothetical protein